MKKIYFSLAFILCTTISVSMLFAQVEHPRAVVVDVPDFYIDALSFANDSLTSRLDVYVQVPYDVLRFVAGNSLFSARYEVTINIFENDNTSLLEKSWSEDIRLSNFEETQSKKAYSLTQRSLNIAPGIYTMRAQVRDGESKKLSTVVRKIIVGNYSLEQLAVSDIMLVSKVSAEGKKKNIVPNISANVNTTKNDFHVFFELYDQRRTDSVEITYSIFNKNNDQIFSLKSIHPLRGNKNQIIDQLDSAQYSSGSYTLSVEVKSLLYGGDGEIVSAKKQRAFIVRWGNLPLNVNDLDLAVKQLRYIAKGKEYDVFEKANTVEEKQKLFQEFWRKRDPSPDTKRNEFMEEYYRRVEYANEHFSHYRKGWQTDMGMVFIIFGPPNNVERHPFDIDSKPYEVWAYYEYNRQVIFIDETGFGDYKLLTPIWDMLQRIK